LVGSVIMAIVLSIIFRGIKIDSLVLITRGILPIRLKFIIILSNYLVNKLRSLAMASKSILLCSRIGCTKSGSCFCVKRWYVSGIK